jgi:hypothetical protein
MMYEMEAEIASLELNIDDLDREADDLHAANQRMQRRVEEVEGMHDENIKKQQVRSIFMFCLYVDHGSTDVHSAAPVSIGTRVSAEITGEPRVVPRA